MSKQLEDPLLDQQIKRERDSFSKGAELFRLKSQLSTFQQGFLKEYLEPLTEEIRKRKEAFSNGTGKAQLSDFPIAALPELDLALITLLTIMHILSNSHKSFELSIIKQSENRESENSEPEGKDAEATFRRTAVKVGEQCRDQYFHIIEREAAEIFIEANSADSLEKQEYSVDERLKTILLRRQTSNEWNAVRRTQEILDAMKNPKWWNLGRLIAVGAALTDMAMKTTGLFEKSYKALGVNFEKQTAVVHLTQKGLNWLTEKRSSRFEHLHESGSLAIPINLPTLVPPKDWQNLFDGGYFTLPSVLVKKNGENFIPDEHYDLEQVPEVLSAVNTLQKTPWRINTRLFENYKICWDYGSRETKRIFLGNDDKKEYDEDPTLPVVLSPEKIAAIEAKIDLAESLLGSIFYFPYQLDFRGRVYAVPQTINHQADDFARSLIEFNTPAPVVEATEYWTAIHLANLYGLNKETLDKRYAWCNENQKAIEALVRDPISEVKFWLTADKKDRFGFLAAAQIWLDIKNGARETHLAVFVDGRCNGLQHLSAMSRDSRAARAVNVISDGLPEDIYTEVKDKLIKIVESDSDPMAKFWRGKIVRDTVKKPVMTTPYGVTPEGIKRQIRAASKELRPSLPALVYLRDRCIEALVEAMKGPTDVKDWLQVVARAIAKKEKPISWTTPVGFRVIQDYRKPLFKRLVTKNYSIRYYLPVDGSRPVNKPKQELGIIANFVHSIDAAHLIKVVNALEAEGVHDIAVIHDSYGVHPHYVPLMNRVIREKFLEIYREPILEKFLDEQIQNTGLDLPRFKKYGDLDIERVLDSEYFFS